MLLCVEVNTHARLRQMDPLVRCFIQEPGVQSPPSLLRIAASVRSSMLWPRALNISNSGFAPAAFNQVSVARAIAGGIT